uniref:AH domain-containing protein n=1 Tax=Macrostomum lignano TaxID=282301 RepID=A0A1I8GQG6_9PLAT
MAGYPGSNYSRYSERADSSTTHKIRSAYWTTKQAMLKKLGRPEDEHVVASDAELDAKLDLFRSVQRTCADLLRTIERYQESLCYLSQSENEFGRFLKSRSEHSAAGKTSAGKMMSAVGKSLSFSAQQRLALRVPLGRLYQEVETFRCRAITDTLLTVQRMEAARTDYRGALLWMRKVSEELDPDAGKQLDRFRSVQAQVRKCKAKFDKLKLDCMQKVDLLAASRCNLLSHVLALYQDILMQFWAKTSRTMSAVSDSFKGYQFYEFNMLKDLVDESRKLASQTSAGSDSTSDPTDGGAEAATADAGNGEDAVKAAANAEDDGTADLIGLFDDEEAVAGQFTESLDQKLNRLDEIFMQEMRDQDPSNSGTSAAAAAAAASAKTSGAFGGGASSS